MAKLRRKRRKIDHFSQWATILFVLSIVMYVASSLAFGTRITAWTMDIQNKENQIQTLKEENEKLTIKIAELENKDRVYEIASTNGLKQNQDNVISVQKNN